jgi:hypothetical protein
MCPTHFLDHVEKKWFSLGGFQLSHKFDDSLICMFYKHRFGKYCNIVYFQALPLTKMNNFASQPTQNMFRAHNP